MRTLLLSIEYQTKKTLRCVVFDSRKVFEMLSLFCCRKRAIKIALIGLDDAGKTSLIYLIKDGIIIYIYHDIENDIRDVEYVEMPLFLSPTYGFTNHVIPIQFKNYKVSLFDLGGSITIRGYWDNYYSEVFIIYLLLLFPLNSMYFI